jgi:hypothetical protein
MENLLEITEEEEKYTLVFDIEQIKNIQNKTVGVFIGTLPKFCQQNIYLGIPLLLSNRDVKLIEEKREGIFAKSNKSMFTPGIRFGGDFCLYPSDPSRFHSSHIIQDQTMASKKKNKSIPLRSIVTLGRLSHHTHKKNLIISDLDIKKFNPIEISWMDG